MLINYNFFTSCSTFYEISLKSNRFLYGRIKLRYKKRVYQSSFNLSETRRLKKLHVDLKFINLRMEETRQKKLVRSLVAEFRLSRAQPSINEKRCLLRGRSGCQERW